MVGSTTPAAIRSSISSRGGVVPAAALASADLADDDRASRRPRCAAIWRQGSSQARRTIATPAASSSVQVLARPWPSAAAARTSATRRPATMPSSIAARVANSASSMRSLRSRVSASVVPPTRMSAAPPTSRRSRSSSCWCLNVRVGVGVERAHLIRDARRSSASCTWCRRRWSSSPDRRRSSSRARDPRASRSRERQIPGCVADDRPPACAARDRRARFLRVSP